MDGWQGQRSRYSHFLGVNGPVIESRWVISLVVVQTTPGAHPSSFALATGSLFWGKAAGAWLLPPTPSSGGVKERLELYVCFPSRPSWHD